MIIQDLMTSAVEFVSTDDSVDKAAIKMTRNNVGAIPVLDRNQKAVGIITDRDITTRVVSVGLVPTETAVTKVMTKNPIVCKESDDIQTAAEIMKEHQIRRLIVQNNRGNFMGVVSLGDLALNVDQSISGEILKEISKPLEP